MVPPKVLRGTYVLYDRYPQVLHVLQDTLLLLRNEGVLHQLGQVLLTDACNRQKNRTQSLSQLLL